MRFISLFAGIGGFDLGFERAGLTCVAQVEKDPAARAILSYHYPHVPQFEDVCDVGRHNLPDAEIICGGFPCQDLSVAGNRAGLAGGRSGLFYEMVRITDELRPMFLIFENVLGLLSSDRGRDFARVLMALDSIGFNGAWTMLDARFFGLAQRRQRIFGVFARSDIRTERCGEILSLTTRMPWNIAPSGGERPRATAAARAGTTRESSNRNIASTVTASAGHHGYSSPRGDGSDNIALQPVSVSENQRGELGQEHGAVLTFRTAQTGANGIGVDESDTAYTLDASGPSAVLARALTAHHGRSDGDSETFVIANALGASTGGPDDNAAQGNHLAVTCEMIPRRLTPTEYERLQGFPDGWTAIGTNGPQADSARYRQCGNAVAVPVAEWLGNRLLSSTGETE